ncbi:uncharacterized protein K452DRAFT_284913 [Aplosporella prunicola CBS 121167]|uniref:Uncharacterized protein n=1 Tax=Aplosporella prunicola CBS 121167 TaxID=1176127 RepID=A0A6A6BKE7_9PEZI|nr:uncharacterized protein K452DRAFT_284913 [Aplosporella prunicola CBS 121167]KAF2144589.1 hypothetical protein K452DRAFT_284913 [Aplosporella prunicola CBS 121167]
MLSLPPRKEAMLLVLQTRASMAAAAATIVRSPVSYQYSQDSAVEEPTTSREARSRDNSSGGDSIRGDDDSDD